MLKSLKLLTALGIAIASVVGLIAAAAGLFLVSTPRPTDLKGCLTTKMFQVRLCPTEPGYVKLKDISLAARNAVIVSEDAGFYGHKGFDWEELRVSFEKNLEKGDYARGGSTISQQLAKNVYLTSEKSLLRKAREALITMQIEEMLTKDEILEKYLNVVEFGPNLYGIGKASRHYFSKPPSQLTAAEGAFLAFLLPNPKKYSVSFRAKKLTPFARKQMKEIVGRLARFRKISEESYQSALAEIDSFYGAPVVADPELEQDLEDSATDLLEPEERESDTI